MSTVKLMPKEDPLKFLEREASSIPVSTMEDLIWSEIDVTKMPVVLIVTPVSKYAFVLQNKIEFNKYLHAEVQPGHVRHYYLIHIDKLWDTSDLSFHRSEIESDRVHKRIYDKKKLMVIQEAHMTTIATELNRTKDLHQIASETGLTKAQVGLIAKKLREAGADIPESRHGLRVEMFVRNLAKTNPDLVKKEVVENSADKHQRMIDRQANRKRGPYKTKLKLKAG